MFYDLNTLAEAYYEGYLEADQLWTKSKLYNEFDVEPTFNLITQSEQRCIKAGLMKAIRSIDPDAKFQP
jgi:hypothetical protein